MKIKLIKEEIVEMTIAEVGAQMRKIKSAEPIIHNGKKYVVVSFDSTTNSFYSISPQGQFKLVGIEN